MAYGIHRDKKIKMLKSVSEFGELHVGRNRS
jgi:hypothetical protein